MRLLAIRKEKRLLGAVAVESCKRSAKSILQSMERSHERYAEALATRARKKRHGGRFRVSSSYFVCCCIALWLCVCVVAFCYGWIAPFADLLLGFWRSRSRRIGFIALCDVVRMVEWNRK